MDVYYYIYINIYIDADFSMCPQYSPTRTPFVFSRECARRRGDALASPGFRAAGLLARGSASLPPLPLDSRRPFLRPRILPPRFCNAPCSATPSGRASPH